MNRVNQIYNSVLLEMDERVIKYLNDNVEDLPFGHIFGDDLRIIIPMYGNYTARAILNTLKRIRDYGGLDLNSGEVIRKIKTQQGEKEQRIKMGSAISKMKLSDEDKKLYLDWLARYRDHLSDVLEDPHHSIVLSRAPIDVLRMSDHSGWTSCHSPGDSEFKCAVQEAINGGAIAYVVANDDLKEYLKEYSLEDDEMFYDAERHGSEMRLPPLARLRVRRLQSDNKVELAIPDIKIYGNNRIPNFYESLVDFLKVKQPTTIENVSQQNWKRRGGTYYDNNINSLVKTYFDTLEELPNYINHDDVDRRDEYSREVSISHMISNIEEECDSIKTQYNNRMKHCSVDYDISWDEGPSCLPFALATMDFEYDLDYDNIDISLEHSDIKQAQDGYYDDEIIWSILLNWVDTITNNNVEIQSFSFVNNTMNIGFTYDGGYTSGDYEDFCGYIDNFDDALVGADWIEIFKEIGIIPVEEESNLYIRLANEGSESMTISNNYGDRGGSWDFFVDTNKDETMKTYSPDKYEMYIGRGLGVMIGNYIKSQYNPSPVSKFSDFFESYSIIMDSDHREILRDNDIDDISIDLSVSENVVNINLQLGVQSFTSKNVDLLLFLDKSYDDLKNMAILVYIKSSASKMEDPKYKDYYDRLFKVYSKFTNL